ncbi:hypothetical protein [Aromatoleum diolicum]|uniref:Cytochrome c domain-containing protein n=1 Tax=Aromatoleum diolicum TaxID=75796 RepID=A0ABX1Q859_9RHOO|nr:hypothetical protein [Aromatoleum diolicum]NMG74265.1 hypothetical protein [Aromatoleum diolicum]
MRAITRASALMLAAALALAGWDYWRKSPPAAANSALAPTPDHAVASPYARPPAATWLVAPDAYGDDLPPLGTSLFDQRVAALGGAAALPYPFEQLLERVEGDARCADLPDGRCLVRVLIPIGRSLQRLAAAPDFFHHPRIVAAMAGEPDSDGPLQRDRLYLGHVGNSDIIEVISYNEAAARFEFQLVLDYRAGGSPRVVYARRALCLSCHQNHAPIFSRPLWQETNANPAVAARLLARQPSFDGVPVQRGIDLPTAIDTATARATRFALWQTLWQIGCGDGEHGVRCRAALFEAALHYRATGRHDYAATRREAIRSAFAAAWQARWPGGLALPDPNIPSRDPLPDDAAQAGGVLLANIPAPFEPLAPRAPLEIWRQADDARINDTVAGLADFLGARDLARLDAAFAGRVAEPADFARVSRAIAALAAADGGPFAAVPFRRDRLMPALLAQLGQAPASASSTLAVAPPVRDAPQFPPAPSAGLFQRYCTPCHQTPASSPPNFLHGDDATVRARLTHCAARIRYRLAMWQLPPDARPKTPMPPQQALRALGADPERWPASAELATLRAYAAELAGGGVLPRPDNYEALAPCLPAPS